MPFFFKMKSTEKEDGKRTDGEVDDGDGERVVVGRVRQTLVFFGRAPAFDGRPQLRLFHDDGKKNMEHWFVTSVLHFSQ